MTPEGEILLQLQKWWDARSGSRMRPVAMGDIKPAVPQNDASRKRCRLRQMIVKMDNGIKYRGNLEKHANDRSLSQKRGNKKHTT